MTIRIKLSTKMAERRIRTISELHRQTGLGRGTLTALWYNNAKRIDLKTLDKLCEVLNCQPSDLLEYVPAQQEQK